MEIRKTEIFVDWLDNLRDSRAKARIIARLDRMEKGNFGVVRPVGGGVNELRINYGPGYRVYFVRRGPVVEDTESWRLHGACNNPLGFGGAPQN